MRSEFLDSFPSPVQQPQTPQQTKKARQAQVTQEAQQTGRIGEIPGYPETGEFSWRASNDGVFIKAANDYNAKNNFSPGDPLYLTPRQLKAWAIIESGGKGYQKYFATDPLQVNNPPDWTDEKTKVAGLTYKQTMTPEISAEAAPKWMLYKMKKQSAPDMYDAMHAYNGNKSKNYRKTHKIPLNDYYATAVNWLGGP